MVFNKHLLVFLFIYCVVQKNAKFLKKNVLAYPQYYHTGIWECYQ